MDASSFSTDEVTPDKVNSIIKFLDANKASGTDKIPIKLVILASDFISNLISKALKMLKLYLSISLLVLKNGFSKIYEIHLKNHLVSSKNHVLIRLLEEWTNV